MGFRRVFTSKDDNPDETVTVFRVTTRERPNPVELKCKRGDVSKEIERIQKAEENQF